MKVFAIIASVLLAVPQAFAQDLNSDQADYQIFEQEAGPMSQEDAHALYYPTAAETNDRGAEIIGGIVGGIIGGIIGGNRPGHGGGHGGYGRSIECYARDFRGNTYRAEGSRRNWQNIQWRATNKCERFSRNRCRPLGCQ